MINRRRFLQTGVGAAAMMALPRRAYPFGQSPGGITKFKVSLPGLGPAGANNMGNYIPVMSADTQRYPGTDYYEIVANQFTQQLHPGLGRTKFWGYADARSNFDSQGNNNNQGEPVFKYLGGVIVAKRGRPVKMKMRNLLPPRHIVPFDITAMDPLMAASGRVDRMAIHLHGGLVHWQSDGGPFAWYSNKNNGGFIHGSSYLNGATGDPGAAIYDYPNDQSARLLWYHDHAYGITRLNAYAGLATGYLITDDAEMQLITSGVLPNIPGYALGIPLIIQDKTFFDPASDPTYSVAGATKGNLWYPHTYEAGQLPPMTLPAMGGGTGRWDLGNGTPPPVSLVPEAFFDTMLVNGAPYPYLPVAPRRYRFRLLNGSNARFVNLQLYVADGSLDGMTLKPSTTETDPNGNPLQLPVNAAGPKILQIGTEGGFLPSPAVLNSPPNPIGYYQSATPGAPRDGNVNRYNLLLAPAERADVIVDFRGFEGKTVIVYNDAPAPFPSGDIRNDYYAGGPDLRSIGGVAPPPEGSGPDTRVIMRFQVGTSGSVAELTFDQTLVALSKALPIAFAATQPTPLLASTANRKVKTLNEDKDSYGRLRQLLGAPLATEYLATPTDFAAKGETQLWEIYNLTADTHPMHFHLVNVQIVKREAFTVDPLGNATPIPGSATGPDANELGWKETVRMNPGEVTTVLMKFDLPPGIVTPSPRLQASYGINGAEYAWHCHILEHEEHDMMHALVVTGI